MVGAATETTVESSSSMTDIARTAAKPSVRLVARGAGVVGVWGVVSAVRVIATPWNGMNCSATKLAEQNVPVKWYRGRMTTPMNGRRAQAARNDTLILDAARAVFVADPDAPIAA